MTNQSKKGPRSDNHLKKIGDKINNLDETQREISQSLHINLDDTSEYDFYDRDFTKINNADLSPTLHEPPAHTTDFETITAYEQDALTNSEQNTTPLDASDAIVQRLRHRTKSPPSRGTATTSNSASNNRLIAPAGKRLLARVFDLSWLLLLILFTVGLILKVANSTAFLLVTQTLSVQLALGILLLPLALVLEAALLKDFGNTLGKYLLGLKIVHKEGYAIKFRHYFKRGFLVWFKGLACGIPFLTLFSSLWQRSQLLKHSATSYDKALGFQVVLTNSSKAKAALMLFGCIALAGIVYLYSPSTVFTASASDALNSLFKHLFG